MGAADMTRNIAGALTGASLLALAIPAAGQEATGCLAPNGQLSRLNEGSSPVGGACPGNSSRIHLALATGDTLTINDEAEVGSMVFLGHLNGFDVWASCAPLDTTRVLVRLDIVNLSNEPLEVLQTNSPQTVAPDQLLNLWAEELTAPQFLATDQAGTFAVTTTGDLYDVRLLVALDDGLCVFGGSARLYAAAERPL
jgi:hypothetical protein